MAIDRPIPAFYCCYLLRSTARHANLYVGSTPNPVRRLGQHNGLTKGGAVRTSRPSLRPWEMTCIVTGFPSNIAALQFEWAWQNSHITLHIPPSSRIQHATQKKRSGHPKRPRHTITSLLSNLHLLLHVPSFSRWPLELRFFCPDVHKAWLKWTKTTAEPAKDITIITDFPPSESAISESTNEEVGESGSPVTKKRKLDYGIYALEVDYVPQKPHVEKGKSVIDFEREGSCSICHTDLEHGSGIYAICPTPSCEAVSHLTCLSKHFLKGEKDDVLIPIKGSCPSCGEKMKWDAIVKELSLRMRGQKEVEKLLKVKRVRKIRGKEITLSQDIVESSEVDDDDDHVDLELSDEEWQQIEAMNPMGKKAGNETGEGIESDIRPKIEDENSDVESLTSPISKTKTQTKTTKTKSSKAGGKIKYPLVIEDSDCNGAEISE